MVDGTFSYIGANSSGNFLYLGLYDFGGVGGRLGLELKWLEGFEFYPSAELMLGNLESWHFLGSSWSMEGVVS